MLYNHKLNHQPSLWLSWNNHVCHWLVVLVLIQTNCGYRGTTPSLTIIAYMCHYLVIMQCPLSTNSLVTAFQCLENVASCWVVMQRTMKMNRGWPSWESPPHVNIIQTEMLNSYIWWNIKFNSWRTKHPWSHWQLLHFNLDLTDMLQIWPSMLRIGFGTEIRLSPLYSNSDFHLCLVKFACSIQPSTHATGSAVYLRVLCQ